MPKKMGNLQRREAIAPLVANRFVAALRAGGYSFEDLDRAAKRRHSQSRSVGRADFDFTIDRLAAIGYALEDALLKI